MVYTKATGIVRRIDDLVRVVIPKGDPIGAVVMCTREPGETVGYLELRLAETTAGFLAKQTEE